MHCYTCKDYVITDSINEEIKLTRGILQETQNQTFSSSMVSIFLVLNTVEDTDVALYLLPDPTWQGDQVFISRAIKLWKKSGALYKVCWHVS